MDLFAVCSDLTWAAGFCFFFLIVTSVWLASCPQAFISHAQDPSVCIIHYLICADVCQGEEPPVWHINQTFLISSRNSSTSPSICLTSQRQSAAAAEVALTWCVAADLSCTAHYYMAAQRGQSRAPVWGITSVSDCDWLSHSCQVRAEERSHSQPAEHLIHRVWAHAELVLIECVCVFCRCTQAQSSRGPVM